ncbi:MAG: hypothetical protein ALAOOOJD_04330 [bacterium]|nr:hypothetical protein [bacterium]
MTRPNIILNITPEGDSFDARIAPENWEINFVLLELIRIDRLINIKFGNIDRKSSGGEPIEVGFDRCNIPDVGIGAGDITPELKIMALYANTVN